MQNTPPQNRIHILVMCPWDILQDRPYASPQIKSQQILKEIHIYDIIYTHKVSSLTIMG